MESRTQELRKQAEPFIESIHWQLCRDAMPDSDQTVLCAFGDEADDPVWLGYHDGDEWCDVSALPFTVEVLAWARVPVGPVELLKVFREAGGGGSSSRPQPAATIPVSATASAVPDSSFGDPNDIHAGGSCT